MANFKLTKEQDNQITRDYIQQHFLFKLDLDPQSATALIGVPKSDIGSNTSSAELIERLNRMGIRASDPTSLRNAPDTLKKLIDVDMDVLLGDGGEVRKPDFGVMVIPNSRLVKALPKIMALDASRIDELTTDGIVMIGVSPKEFRHFVQATGVDFAGKSVVLPDVVLDEKVKAARRSEGEARTVTKRVAEELAEELADRYGKQQFTLTGKTPDGAWLFTSTAQDKEERAKLEKELIHAVKKDMEINGAEVLDSPKLRLPDSVKAKVKSELEEAKRFETDEERRSDKRAMKLEKSGGHDINKDEESGQLTPPSTPKQPLQQKLGSGMVPKM
jgi:hypothetical protein